jgi:prepilin-type N-terminal cleavage/methylation domain-containing protein
MRGFTLMELMAVVLIITVFASLAVPTAVVQMRDRRIQESARQIALVYRQARLRAMGRGAAVLVRFDTDSFSVLEARQGGPGTCADLPVSSCLDTPWVSTPDRTRVVDGHAEATGGDLANVSISMVDATDNPITELEVCFTPMGRAFAREDINDAVAFTPMTEAYLASVSRPGLTRTREVVLMPNGTARLSARALP